MSRRIAGASALAGLLVVAAAWAATTSATVRVNHDAPEPHQGREPKYQRPGVRAPRHLWRWTLRRVRLRDVQSGSEGYERRRGCVRARTVATLVRGLVLESDGD